MTASSPSISINRIALTPTLTRPLPFKNHESGRRARMTTIGPNCPASSIRSPRERNRAIDGGANATIAPML
jgi:hypothetical protein